MSSAISASQRALIIEYWRRLLLSNGKHISLRDIIKMIIKFGEFETFAPSISSRDLAFNKDHTIISLTDTRFSDRLNAFGSTIAKPGKIYEWDVQIIGAKASAVIGICMADRYHMRSWWNEQFTPIGYAGVYKYYDKRFDNQYYCQGYHPDRYIMDGDVIRVKLDLKDKFELFIGHIFDKEEYHKKFNVKKNTSYRLAVALCSGQLKAFSIQIN